MRREGLSDMTLRALIVVGLLANGSCNRFQEAWVMNCDHTVSIMRATATTRAMSNDILRTILFRSRYQPLGPGLRICSANVHSCVVMYELSKRTSKNNVGWLNDGGSDSIES